MRRRALILGLALASTAGVARAATAAQDETTVANDAKALAIVDLATLQTFYSLATNTSTTLGSLASAMAGLQSSLGSPVNQQAVSLAGGIYSSFTSAIQQLVDSATMTAATTTTVAGSTAQQDYDTLVNDTAILASADLASLTTFNNLLLNSFTTVAQVSNGFTTLLAALGDPGRIAAVNSAAVQYNQFIGAVKTLISINNHLAGN